MSNHHGDPTVYTQAHALHAHGIRVIPVRADGTKAPALHGWQNHETTSNDIEYWFGGDQPRHTALGVVTGPDSGNIEMAEIEGAYVHLLAEINDLAEASGLGNLWDRVRNGWVEMSPSGGIHWIYKIAGNPVPGNTKIAQDAPRTVNGKTTHPTIAETRGRGGQFVAAPTSGSAHDTGKPWVRISGGPDTIAVLTDEERNQLHALLGSLDRRPAPATNTSHATTAGDSEWAGVLADLEATGPTAPIPGKTPGDDYEEKTCWEDLLEPAGWTKVFTQGHTTYWRRPGKETGFSATTGRAEDRDRLYVFSSSTEFPTNEPITKFSAYATMNHAGDHARAASKLRKDGYGEPLPDKTRPAPDQQTTLVREPSRWADIGLRSHQRMAARLAQKGENKLLFVTGSGWHHWTGSHWAEDKRAKRAYRELSDLLKDSWIEAVDDKDLSADVRSCMSANGTKGVLELASRLPELSADHVDSDPYILNTPTGTLDLHTLTTRPHNPADRLTKITRASYDPAANNTRWTEFLNSSLPNPTIQGFLQRYIGVSLIGEVIEQLLVIMTGDGRNGKGVLANAVEFALGDYAITANNQMLVSGRYRGESAGEKSSLMRLRGARLAFMSELEKGAKLAEATMKALTGGDQIEAKFMGQDAVQFEPTHNFLMLTNDLPAVDPTAQAVWARLRVVPFDISFEGREDHALPNDLRLAANTILTWAVNGLATYREQGLNAPPEVLATTEHYRTENDPIAQFIEEECLLGPDAKVTRASLHHAYLEWAKDNGMNPISAHKFSPRIGGMKGIDTDAIHGLRRWIGIGLKSEQDEDPPGDPWGTPADTPPAFKDE